jgi:hypothetical protein
MTKDHVSAEKSQNLDITDITASIPVEMCHHAVQSAFNHVTVCIQNGRQQAEAVR